jgi:hypothetical protein
VQVAEPVQGGQLEHPEDLVLEEDRQHDEVRRRQFSKPGADGHVAWRRVLDQDPGPVKRGLPGEALPYREAGKAAAAEPVGGDPVELVAGP